MVFEPGTGGLFYPEVFQETDCRTFADICMFILKHLPNNVQVIETGTAYWWDPEHTEHSTTACLVKYLTQPLEGMLYTIDIESRWKHVQMLSLAAGFNQKYINVIKNDSVKAINDLASNTLSDKSVSVLCLDSGEDPDHTVQEFLATKKLLNDNHYVLVDDIHNAGSFKYFNIVPLLQKEGYDYVQIPTPTGLFVASKNLPLPRK